MSPWQDQSGHSCPQGCRYRYRCLSMRSVFARTSCNTTFCDSAWCQKVKLLFCSAHALGQGRVRPLSCMGQPGHYCGHTSAARKTITHRNTIAVKYIFKILRCWCLRPSSAVLAFPVELLRFVWPRGTQLTGDMQIAWHALQKRKRRKAVDKQV